MCLLHLHFLLRQGPHEDCPYSMHAGLCLLHLHFLLCLAHHEDCPYSMHAAGLLLRCQCFLLRLAHHERCCQGSEGDTKCRHAWSQMVEILMLVVIGGVAVLLLGGLVLWEVMRHLPV